MKLYAFDIEESIGEYDFASYMLVYAEDLDDANKKVHGIMMAFRGDKEDTEYDEETEYYTYFGGDVCSIVTDIYEVTETEWKDRVFKFSCCDPDFKI